MKEQKDKEKVYCIFNSEKENKNGISWYLSFKEPPEICKKNISDNKTKNE